MSAAALSFVARRVSAVPLGVLAAVRTGAATSFDRSGCTEVEVGPLDDDAAERLVRSRFPGLTEAQVARLVGEARGNALALLELPTAVLDGHLAAAPVGSSSASVSGRVRDLFASRVDSLPAPSRQLLLLTVFSGRGELTVLRSAAGPTALADLAPAERANLVSVDDRARRVQFRTRWPAPPWWPCPRRRSASRPTACWPAQSDGDVVRRAHHLAGASIGPNEEAARALDTASRYHLRRGDPNGAVEALVRAAQLSPSRPTGSGGWPWPPTSVPM